MENSKKEPTLRRAYSINLACEAYSLSRAFAYEAIKAGLLKVRYAGTKPIITEEAAQDFINNLPLGPVSKAERLKEWGLEQRLDVKGNTTFSARSSRGGKK